MSESSYAQSIKARLLNKSGGDNKRYQQLIVRYFHERLLYRLSKSNYKERFILKGGAMLYAFDELVPRPTLDIDFMGYNIGREKGIIMNAFKEIISLSYPEDGIEFLPDSMKAEDITIEKRYPGVRIFMSAKIGTYIQNLNIDIGFGDVIVPYPLTVDYPSVLPNMEEASVLAYSLETVVAEKLHAIIDRGKFNSRMKDYFDLYRIFSVHSFDKTVLCKAIQATFENRGLKVTDKEGFFEESFGKDALISQQWEHYMKKMKVALPSFVEIHKSIVLWISPYWKHLCNCLH